jgi:phosphohistidine phosphatase SixA
MPPPANGVHTVLVARRRSTTRRLSMAKEIELRRHTDSEGDALTQDGVDAALELGARLRGSYQLLASSGAQRATQTLACFACALAERIPGGAIVEAGLRSDVEERWRQAYQDAGSGELEALRSADPELVQEDSAVLAAALGRVFDRLEDGGRALVVGHSPTNEAAVLGFTGEIVEPMSKGAGVLVVLEDGQARVGSSFD